MNKTVLKWVVGVLLAIGIPATLAITNFNKIAGYWITPDYEFDLALVPEAPDYSDIAKFWAAHPGKTDTSDLKLTGNLHDKLTSEVDVFFVHPTAYYGSENWNSDMAPEKGASQIIDYMLAAQTSMFNHCCRIYAPHYREAHISAFSEEKRISGEQALNLAYSDVAKSFDYYLEHFNEGRPFILLSHSQGTFHLTRLMEEKIDKTELLERMLVAYAIGYEFPMDKFDRAYQNITACESAEDLHCVVSWAAYGEGTDFNQPFSVTHWYPEGYERSDDKETLCINPLSWKQTPNRIDKATHLGALPMPIDDFLKIALFNEHTGHGPQGLGSMITEYSFAQCKNGRLLIEHKPDSKFAGGVDDKLQNYHAHDINLFYGNIQRNVVTRIANFYLN